jgi:hypothetical protein
MPKNEKNEAKGIDESPVRLDLLRAFKRIKAFAQINVESLNKKLLEDTAIKADVARIRVFLDDIDRLVEYIDA